MTATGYRIVVKVGIPGQPDVTVTFSEWRRAKCLAASLQQKYGRSAALDIARAQEQSPMWMAITQWLEGSE